MHHFFVRADQIIEEADGKRIVSITGTDVRHAKQVLRIKPGEELLISDGTGKDYRCEVLSLETDEVTAKIIAEEEDRELPSELLLYQGLAKGEKMEWIIQKAVELGACRIVPVMTKNTVVKLDKKKEEHRRQRWQAIAESAAKQAKRSIVPEVAELISLEEGIKQSAGCEHRLFAYEHQKGMSGTAGVLEQVKSGQKIAVFIGPEGGFSPEEAKLAEESGLSFVSLGKRILRTETAGLALLSVLMMRLECERPLYHGQ